MNSRRDLAKIPCRSGGLKSAEAGNGQTERKLEGQDKARKQKIQENDNEEAKAATKKRESAEAKKMITRKRKQQQKKGHGAEGKEGGREREMRLEV